MVRKNCKRSPAKSIRDLRSHQRRRHLHNRKRNGGDGNAPNNGKDASSASCSTALLSTISRKASRCKNRLIRIFSKLAAFVDTPKTGSRYRGYQMLKDRLGGSHDVIGAECSVRKILCFEDPLPPSISPSKPTVFLDLDETLVHSVANDPPANFDFIVRPRIGGTCVTFYVLKRPGLDEFLEALAKKFELVVFTAGLEEYASMVLDNVDRKKLISHRLYRDSCNQVNGMYVKDLSRTGRDLTNAVIVDDNPNAYLLQPENAIPVRPFVDDLWDAELAKLGKFFDGCDGFGDIRDAVKMYVSSGRNEAGEDMAIS
ncbi:unnamed protein product [Linum tenue]|uniref:FCP1 homology domain-containing protein n=2 Tax=Linum tenue TaxID=586396 RepID=A0AAV0PWV3_9ROSI|nr:unnamed protein product [Linum tenue]